LRRSIIVQGLASLGEVDASAISSYDETVIV